MLDFYRSRHSLTTPVNIQGVDTEIVKSYRSQQFNRLDWTDDNAAPKKKGHAEASWTDGSLLRRLPSALPRTFCGIRPSLWRGLLGQQHFSYRHQEAGQSDEEPARSWVVLLTERRWLLRGGWGRNSRLWWRTSSTLWRAVRDHCSQYITRPAPVFLLHFKPWKVFSIFNFFDIQCSTCCSTTKGFSCV